MRGLVVGLALLAAGCGPRCLKYESMCHRDAWVQHMLVGQVLVPIHHPATDYPCGTCLEYAPE